MQAVHDYKRLSLILRKRQIGLAQFALGWVGPLADASCKPCPARVCAVELTGHLRVFFWTGVCVYRPVTGLGLVLRFAGLKSNSLVGCAELVLQIQVFPNIQEPTWLSTIR